MFEESAREQLVRVADAEAATVGEIDWCRDGTPKVGEDVFLKDAVKQLTQRYEGPPEFWTEETLPTWTMDSLISTKDSWAYNASKDSLPSMYATKESLPSMYATKDSLPSMYATRDSLPPFCAKKKAHFDVSPTTTSNDTSEMEEEEPARARGGQASGEEEQAATLKSKWLERRQQRNNRRQTGKKASYGELLRKKYAHIAARPVLQETSPRRANEPLRSLSSQSMDQLPPWDTNRGNSRALLVERMRLASLSMDLPRGFHTMEKLPTIASDSREDSENASKTSSRLHSQRGSRTHSRQQSRPHSRQVSRPATLDVLPELSLEDQIQMKKDSRFGTKDSLPPIEDDAMESEESEQSDSPSDETPRSKEDTQADEHGRAPAGTACLGGSATAGFPGMQIGLSACDAASLQAAHAEIAALKAEMEEIRRSNSLLQRENKVLKALAFQSDALRNISHGKSGGRSGAKCGEQAPVVITPPDVAGSDTSDGESKATNDDMKISTVADSMPETEASAAEEYETKREQWLQRRAARRLRRGAGSNQRVSYGSWLQAQYEQLPPKSAEDLAGEGEWPTEAEYEQLPRKHVEAMEDWAGEGERPAQTQDTEAAEVVAPGAAA